MIFTAACVQNCASGDSKSSIAQCVELIREAQARGADLICLPEYCHHLEVRGKAFDAGASPESGHPALSAFRPLASALGVWLLVGSVAVLDETGQQRNRSMLINPEGGITARYDKIHMFDVNLSDGESYRESDSFSAGDRVVAANTPFARLGLSVCYDLRFPALYRILAQDGADVLCVPAAFTYTTGKAHWHILLRSRAIETGSYVIAPCQYGFHGDARTFGHSLIIDPWGEILAEGEEDEPGVITAGIDPSKVAEARARIPALQHDRPLIM